MAVTHSAGAKKAMREAVSAMRTGGQDWIVYYERMDLPKGLDALTACVVNADNIEQAKAKTIARGPNYVLAAEPRDQGLEAKRKFGADPRMPKDKGLFIEQRVSWLRSMAETQATPGKRVLKPKACTGCGATDGQHHALSCPTMHPLSDEAEAISRAAVKGELEDGAYGVERNMRTPYWQQMLEGDWKVDPSPTPFMQHAMKTEKMTRKEAEGLYGTSMAEFAQQAMRGADFERKLEQVRKDQEELCGIKVSVDPAVGCDDFVIYTPARQQGKSWYAAAAEKLWGKHAGQWIATVHDEVMHADPSALRDAQAMARGTCKPQNKPHKDEKPANPYPPAHPRAEPPAGLLAVSDMSARMGNRWAP